jgi:hypothetical protein
MLYFVFTTILEKRFGVVQMFKDMRQDQRLLGKRVGLAIAFDVPNVVFLIGVF